MAEQLNLDNDGQQVPLPVEPAATEISEEELGQVAGGNLVPKPPHPPEPPHSPRPNQW
jgi:mersacidin/lichenicidin family type 2 lantibiotic